MRTETPSSPAWSLAALRARLAEAGRRVAAWGLPVRWLVGIVGLAALLALASWMTIPSTGKYLGGGRQYPLDDLAKVTAALDREHLEYRVEDRRIGVAADRYDDAMDAVAKLDLRPRSVADIRKDALSWSLLEPLTAKDQRDQRAREEILETFIRKLDGIESADVRINRSRVWSGIRPSATATAFVWLETEDDREVGSKTVQAIQSIIVGNEPDLSPDSVTVFTKNRHYLVAGDPALGALSRNRALEEGRAQEVLERLDWIKGVRVTVQMVAAPPRAAAIAGVPRSAVAAEPVAAPPQIGVNQPIGLEPGPGPTPAPTPAATAGTAPARAEPEPAVTKVWVQVPLSFYYLTALPHRNPSPDDLQPLVAKTETLVRTAVGHVVPPDELGEVTIDTFPDNLAAREPLVAPAVPETRRPFAWWVPAGVGGASAATVVALAFRLASARRPRRPRATVVGRRADLAEEGGPGPSERVRALIRRNPEAAASVLHRWIGQGGHAE